MVYGIRNLRLGPFRLVISRPVRPNAAPGRERILRVNRINIWLAGSQGVMQIAIIGVMARLVM
jgi:hypothetical protein